MENTQGAHLYVIVEDSVGVGAKGFPNPSSAFPRRTLLILFHTLNNNYFSTQWHQVLHLHVATCLKHFIMKQ